MERHDAALIESWDACPQCGSNDIEGGSVDIEDRRATQHLDCIRCGADWHEVYVAAYRLYTVAKEATG